jgi:hypothetical protein
MESIRNSMNPKEIKKNMKKNMKIPRKRKKNPEQPVIVSRITRLPA